MQDLRWQQLRAPPLPSTARPDTMQGDLTTQRHVTTRVGSVRPSHATPTPPAAPFPPAEWLRTLTRAGKADQPLFQACWCPLYLELPPCIPSPHPPRVGGRARRQRLRWRCARGARAQVVPRTAALVPAAARLCCLRPPPPAHRPAGAVLGARLVVIAVAVLLLAQPRVKI